MTGRLRIWLLAATAAAMAAGACAHAPAGDGVSAAAAAARTDATRALVRRYLAAAEAQDMAAVLACFHEDARYEDPTFAFAIQGHAAIRGMMRVAFAMLRPAERRILREVYDGEQAVIEWEASGPHAGAVLGVAPTGRQITVRAVSLIRLERGLIRSVTDYTDRAGLEAQLRAGAGG